MRTTIATLALLAIVATASVAQVPRTMNFQGRVADPAAPVTGTRTMTLRLYTSATGGAPIFSETQSVEFKNGIFTVAIGGATPGGIPDGVEFDRQYWLGVTITGFNNGNELTPRFILRSSPYSLRAEVADSAGHAATAGQAEHAAQLQLPVTFESSNSTGAILTVTNHDGTGLQVRGENYAIVSEGVDSTGRYYVAGESAGSDVAPTAGALYRDNTPIAWATVERDGSIVSDFGVASVGKPTEQGFEVVLDRPVRSIQSGSITVPEFSPVIVVGGGVPPSGETYRVFTNWSYKRDPGGALNPQTIMVRFTDIQGNFTPVPFSIVIFGRPE